MRALAGIVIFIGLVVAAFALFFPGEFRMQDEMGVAEIVWLLGAAILVGFGAFGMAGRAQIGFGRALLFLLAWAALIVGALLLYQLYQSFSVGGRVTT